MIKTNTYIKLGALAITLGTLGIGSTTMAYQGDPAVTGPNYSTERHEAMEKAFDQEDYSAWLKLMDGRGRVTQLITQSNFPQFVRAHDLAEKGDLTGAQEIRRELGLGQGQGRGKGQGQGQGQGQHRGGGNGSGQMKNQANQSLNR